MPTDYKNKINVLHNFNKLIKAYKSNREDDYTLAAISMFEFVSFRWKILNNSFAIILLKITKDTLVRFFGTPKKNTYSSSGNLAVLDVDFRSENIRLAYVQEVLKKKPIVFFSKNNLLLRGGLFFNLKIISHIIILFFKLTFINKTKGNKVNFALALKEVIEIECFLHQLNKYNITELIDFANYEVDSNFLYLLLKQKNITVYKVPSPGPLYMHNKILLTDYLILSSGYQLEEIDKIKTIKTKYIIKAIPEMGLNYLKKYIGNQIVIDKVQKDNIYTLGYYSHASWMRAKNKDADNGINLHQSEEITLHLISEFLNQNPKFSLKIFLHPREKKYPHKEHLYSYYNNILKNSKFQFAPVEMNSTDSFNEINVAIVALSTILFERLFVGKKILICKAGIKGFPIKESSLNNISFNTIKELQRLMNEIVELNDDTFYNKFDLNLHRYSNFMDYTPGLMDYTEQLA